MLRTKEHTPTPYLSDVFTFGFEVESIKKFRGASPLEKIQMLPMFSFLVSV
jgi:hypothetical protein